MRFGIEYAGAAIALLGALLPADSSPGQEIEPAALSNLETRCDAVCGRVVSCLEGTLRDLERSVRSLSVSRWEGPEAERVLRGLIEMYQDSTGLMLVDTGAVVVAAYPERLAGAVGTSLARSEGWHRMQAEKTAVLCEMEPLADGPVAWSFLVPLAERGGRPGGTLLLMFPLPGLFRAICHELKDTGTAFEVFLPDGRLVYENPLLVEGKSGLSDLLGTGRASVLAVHRRVLAEASGASSYALLDEDSGALSSRELRWTHCEFRGLKWVIACGQAGTFVADDASPLAGRWIGAFSDKGPAADAGGPRSGQMNVSILQDGSRVELWTGAREWRGTASGLFVEGRLSAARVEPVAGGSPAVWFWKADYDGGGDTLKGTIWGDARSVMTERAFFLRRVTADP